LRKRASCRGCGRGCGRGELKNETIAKLCAVQILDGRF